MNEPWGYVYFFRNARGGNVIKAWLEKEKVPKEQIAAFQDKIDTLEQSGPEMVSGFISSGPVVKDIYKMKIKGHKGFVQLRPMCCEGPLGQREYTVLCGAIEKDNKNIPADAPERAQENRRDLLADPTRRVRERLTNKPKK